MKADLNYLVRTLPRNGFILESLAEIAPDLKYATSGTHFANYGWYLTKRGTGFLAFSHSDVWVSGDKFVARMGLLA
jgi:hypothetical protein